MIIDDPSKSDYSIWATYYVTDECPLKDLPVLHFNEDSFITPLQVRLAAAGKGVLEGRLLITTHITSVMPEHQEPDSSDLFTVFVAVDVKKFTFAHSFHLAMPDLRPHHFEIVCVSNDGGAGNSGDICGSNIGGHPFTTNTNSNTETNTETETNTVIDPCPPGEKNLYGHPLRCLIATLPKGEKKISISKGKHTTLTMIVKKNIDMLEQEQQKQQQRKHQKQKQSVTITDLSTMLDPSLIAKEASNLNLRLMKWNHAPSLSLPILSSATALVCGCGTLGTQVIRTLLGWSINKLSVIDSSCVQYSNPLRQCLWRAEDIGASKAACAAERCLEIDPSCAVKALNFRIPTPADVEDMVRLEDIESLFEWIEESNVIFLLTDSRESRYLPSLIASVLGKTTITIGLGFDSFVVMRSGGGCGAASDLSCYFCSDPLLPRGASGAVSAADFSLDQQCTVSRPGLSAIAAGFGVEMAISVLQHPLGNGAPVCYGDDGDDVYQRLGNGIDSSDINGINAINGISNNLNNNSNNNSINKVPHQLRGYLSNFKVDRMVGQRNNDCCCCRPSFREEYYKLGRCAFISEFLIPFMMHGGVLEAEAATTPAAGASAASEIDRSFRDIEDDF